MNKVEIIVPDATSATATAANSPYVWLIVGAAVVIAVFLIIDAAVAWRKRQRELAGEVIAFSKGRPSLFRRACRRLFFPPA